MAMPKSVTKLNKDGVQFTSSVDKIEYTITELSKAALRDCAKLVRREAKANAPVRKIGGGNLKKNIGTWVRIDKSGENKGKPYLQVGVYNNATAKKKGLKSAFYGMFYEFGTSKQTARPFLRPAVYNNIDELRKIQAQYLSAIEDEQRAISKIEEGEEISDD